MPAIKYYTLPYVEIFVFDKYMITQVKEGTVLEAKNNDELNEIAQKHFTGRNFVYIANRVFEYNVSPVTYLESAKISNLVGVCIITETEMGKRIANFESGFYPKEFFIASTIEEATKWAINLVDSK